MCTSFTFLQMFYNFSWNNSEVLQITQSLGSEDTQVKMDPVFFMLKSMRFMDCSSRSCPRAPHLETSHRPVWDSVVYRMKADRPTPGHCYLWFPWEPWVPIIRPLSPPLRNQWSIRSQWTFSLRCTHFYDRLYIIAHWGLRQGWNVLEKSNIYFSFRQDKISTNIVLGKQPCFLRFVFVTICLFHILLEKATGLNIRRGKWSIFVSVQLYCT